MKVPSVDLRFSVYFKDLYREEEEEDDNHNKENKNKV
jgi:hypothetical protein